MKGYVGSGRQACTVLGTNCVLCHCTPSKDEQADFFIQFLTGLQSSSGPDLPPDAGHVPMAPALSSYSPSAMSPAWEARICSTSPKVGPRLN